MKRNIKNIIKIKQRWAKLWLTNPDKMTEILQRARVNSINAKKHRNENLKKLIATWPAEMTTEQFNELCNSAIATNTSKTKQRAKSIYSLRRRLTRLNYVQFNYDNMTWINKCLFPS